MQENLWQECRRIWDTWQIKHEMEQSEIAREHVWYSQEKPPEEVSEREVLNFKFHPLIYFLRELG